MTGSGPPMTITSSTLMMGLTDNSHGFHFDAAADDETEKIVSQVKQCLAKDCSVESVNDLVHALKEHQQDIKRRIEEIQAMGKTLERLVDKSDGGITGSASINSISSRETVRAVSRLLEEGGYKKRPIGSIDSSRTSRIEEMSQNENFADEFLFQNLSSTKNFSP